MHSPPVEKCITDSMLRWEFPRSPGGVPTEVAYPFVLKAAE
jgi:hypothetical protein